MSFVRNYALSKFFGKGSSGSGGGDLKALVERTITEIEDDTIKVVGNSAFKGCIALTSADLPNCASIGNGAFEDCASLKNVNMPKIAAVPYTAFKACGLESANFPLVTTIARDSFQNCKSLREANFPLVTHVGGQNGYNGAFSGCSSLVTVNAPNVTTIYNYGFSDCKALESLNSPLLSRIAESGFSGCAALKHINVSAVKILEGGAFFGCTALERVDFHVLSSVNGNHQFRGCSSLTAVIIRTDGIPTLTGVNMFTETPIESGTGYIYVLRKWLSDTDATMDFRRGSNWSVYGTQFRVLEDYTVDGTIWGELDESKI
jgi:hypothetical protein